MYSRCILSRASTPTPVPSSPVPAASQPASVRLNQGDIVAVPYLILAGEQTSLWTGASGSLIDLPCLGVAIRPPLPPPRHSSPQPQPHPPSSPSQGDLQFLPALAGTGEVRWQGWLGWQLWRLDVVEFVSLRLPVVEWCWGVCVCVCVCGGGGGGGGAVAGWGILKLQLNGNSF